MFGAEAGKIDNLPIVQNPKDEQKPWGPGDLFLPDRRIDELPAVGVNLLQSIKNKDHCYLLGGVSAARPKQTADVGQQQALLEISLPYQQFTNIAGAYLCDQLPDLRGQNGEEIQKRLLFGLQNLMSLDEKDAEDSILVGVGPDPQDSSRTIVQVRVTPPARIVPGGLHVDFGFPIPA
jgi:predicted component of type VI protein secretion system